MSSSVNGDPENKGTSAKNKENDPEINPMAKRMKQEFNNNALVAVKQTLTIAPMIDIKKNDIQMQSYENRKDVFSIKGIFSWKVIEKYQIPYIIRVINGIEIEFTSTRMAETQLLNNYMHYLNADIFACTSIVGYFITNYEARLLNEINQSHVNHLYGNEMFVARKDYIVRLNDVQQFYTFIEICYNTLLRNINTGLKEKCGFIRQRNSELLVPYCITDNQKFVPLFFFSGKIESLKHQAVKLKNWNLAYLKFCCTLQGIKNEHFASDSWLVISLDVIKNCYPTDTIFEDFWPPNKFFAHFRAIQNSTHINPSGAWIRKPAIVPAARMKTYRNGQLANQMGAATSQNSSLRNSASHVVPPPAAPLGYVGNTAQVIGNDISSSNVVPFTQYETIMYNLIFDMDMRCMTLSNQMRQLFGQYAIHNSQAQQLQIPQIQQQQQQQKKKIASTQTQQLHSSQTVHGHLTNSQVLNTSGNVGPISNDPTTKIIDLTSTPSIPVPSTVLKAVYELKLMIIPEQEQVDRNGTEYKVKRIIVNGKIIYCINAEPYNHTQLLVSLKDIVNVISPRSTVLRCMYVLQKYLRLKLFIGNAKQLTVLRQNGCRVRISSKYTPMAMLQDIVDVWKRLISLFC